MLIKKLTITTEGIKHYIEAINHENDMYTLYHALEIIGCMEDLVKKGLHNDSISDKKIDYNFFDSFGLKVINKDDFMLYSIFLDQDPSYFLTIRQELLWQAAKEYDKIRNLPWKKLIISYDGNNVFFEPEY